ncbi:FemAB-related protein, PEP-CTERM system-associated [Bosea sp. LC85]|uniref:FemAB family XrtA/PEP-CTERM system-associated protein n=1 Tax=Bosea sp. LC85 TaxID=1502851 RepID=UPI0004E3BC11|nr:FemAB family XrtA/PEP-CTERM system-associated protein [Bosea sp. LC85]KFC70989.1 FemAB-related protein, PEP-CTERM system-associated [Bosea sp. LC85]
MQYLEVVDLSQTGGDDEWQAYVDSIPGSSQYYGLEWRGISERSFGHRSWYLMVRGGGRVRGVLPLVEMQSALFGHFFVSLPFLDYGGILADTPECEAALATAAADLAAKRGARHIELRQPGAATHFTDESWTVRQHKAALVVDLSENQEKIWSNLSSRLRGKVRKATKSGAVFSVEGSEALGDFYRVFALNMRDLGTPVYSPAFFENILQSTKDTVILLVRREGRAVAGAIALRRGERIELPWICSDYAHASHQVNEFLYWNAITWAGDLGARELDLGRCSIDSGTYRFKMQWNPEVRPLSWYYWLAPGTAMPELSPSNTKYAFAIRCWKRMPVALANRLGPWIVRSIP